MSDTVITADRLGKAYRLGLKVDKNATLRDALAAAVRSPLKRLRARADAEANAGAPDTFWAIKDISFQVNKGEVLGLVGRNGAGKSTLLKVLSRITEPTEGTARMRGRVASLLEVGTGFHPELTGRENVYLNGSILGMTRAEISSKFDEIVAFSEVEKFLDTPVKRYSSGMYVRLAFAVAAHLEPEILIVDEVLAVGDGNFQRKCLGKMGDVVRDGRTILFVSHNMDAVAQLCTHTVLLANGQCSEKMSADDGIKKYLAMNGDGTGLPLAQKPREQNRKRPPIFVGLNVWGEPADGSGEPHPNVVESGGKVTFEIDVADCADLKSGAMCTVCITNDRGHRVAFFHSLYQGGFTFKGADHAKFTCVVPSLPLVANSYSVELVMADGYGIIEKVERAGNLDVVFADVLGTGKIPSNRQGYVVWPAEWDYTGEREAAGDLLGV